VTGQDAYQRLLRLLEEGKADFRIIEHAPEGRTELVSAMRGHPVAEAAKCLVLLVKLGKKVTKFVLAVVPGDARVDLEAIRRLKSATILPFAFDDALELIVDPQVAGSQTMYFNAGRLDRSLALRTADYLRLAAPRVERIALGAEPPAVSEAHI
jgi:Ala-tRNA(Pro) deacylase